MGGNTDPGCTAPAANGHEDYIQFRLVFQHFQPFGSYSCDEQRFVTGMNVAIAIGVDQCLAMQLGIVKVHTMLDDFRAHTPHGGHLPRIGYFRHHDDGLDSKKPGGIGDRLPVIAR